MRARCAGRLEGGGLAGRDRPAQREDQLQGARAFAGQGAGHPRLRQQGGGRTHRLDPPPRQPGPDADVARRGAEGARRRGRPAGPAPRRRRESPSPKRTSPSTASTSSNARSPEARRGRAALRESGSFLPPRATRHGSRDASRKPVAHGRHVLLGEPVAGGEEAVVDMGAVAFEKAGEPGGVVGRDDRIHRPRTG